MLECQKGLKDTTLANDYWISDKTAQKYVPCFSTMREDGKERTVHIYQLLIRFNQEAPINQGVSLLLDSRIKGGS